eukprot:2630619-Rhodomonas_salina.2
MVVALCLDVALHICEEAENVPATSFCLRECSGQLFHSERPVPAMLKCGVLPARRCRTFAGMSTTSLACATASLVPSPTASKPPFPGSPTAVALPRTPHQY